MDSVPLTGGRVSTVRRVGGAVVRSAPPNSRYVHSVLDHLAKAGWSGAPAVLAHDVPGQEALTFLDGAVPWQRPVPGWAVTDRALAAVARLVRQLHDLTAGTALAGEQQVVCHHDLSPSNTVYRTAGSVLLPAAFLDWDLAGPDRRVQDVAHVCWQWLDLGPGVPDVDEARRQMLVVADAYGLAERDQLLPAVLQWQDRCWRGIESSAAAGNRAMQQLLACGVPAGIRAAYVWTSDHQAHLDISAG